MTVLSASASYSVEFVNPTTWTATMYDSQDISKDYVIKNIDDSKLEDCRIELNKLQAYATLEPEEGNIVSGGTRKFTLTIEKPPVGTHEILLDIVCSGTDFNYTAEGYSPELVLKVKEDPGACNIMVSRPVSKYISFIGLPGTKSMGSAVSVINTDIEKDNFTFMLDGVNCSLNANSTIEINGDSQFDSIVSECMFEQGDVDGKLIISSSKCDTAVNIRLSNSKLGHYFGIAKQYKWWVIIGAIVFLFLVVMAGVAGVKLWGEK